MERALSIAPWTSPASAVNSAIRISAIVAYDEIPLPYLGVARLAQQLQCHVTFSSRGAAAQHQALSNVRKFEGDIVAALFGNPHSFGGFPHRVVVGEQRPGQNAEGSKRC